MAVKSTENLRNVTYTALNAYATIEGIATVARSAATRRPMVFSIALRVGRTRVSDDARIQALPVVALLIVGTLAIRHAAH